LTVHGQDRCGRGIFVQETCGTIVLAISSGLDWSPAARSPSWRQSRPKLSVGRWGRVPEASVPLACASIDQDLNQRSKTDTEWSRL